MSEEPRSGSFRIAQITLRYVEWGDAAAPPVVLLHGGLDNARTWDDIARPLSADWRVLALDLRGHGDSDWSPSGDYNALSYLSDILGFLRATVGGPAAIISHSMGARLSLQLAGAVPEAVSRLVAIEGLGGERGLTREMPLDDRMREWLTDRSQRRASGVVAQVGGFLRSRAELRYSPPHVHHDMEARIARQLADRKKRLTPAQARAFVESNMRPAPGGGWTWKHDPLCRWQNAHEIVEPHHDYWAAITAPVLHVYGRDSWAFPPAEQDLAAFRDARLAVIDEAGHWSHLNQPEKVLAQIRGFLKRPAGQGADAS
jgi:pimeloyl-ACP methyl ester carboxylesterase